MTHETTTTIPAVSAHEVYDRLLRNRQRLIVDVRNEDDFQRWRIEGASSLRTVNVPYFDFLEEEEASVASVPADAEALVVCAKEGSSQFVAEILQSHGYQVSYLADGILSWGNLYDARDVINEPFGRIVQIARPARGDLSFVVISDGEAAVIDPLRHIEHYLDAAGDARITHILDTHAHADHISGGPALAEATGSPYYLHPYDAIHPIDMLPATLPYESLSDGQRFQVGQFEVRVIWFPGHTLGQVNFLFIAPTGQRYLFSGDGLFLRSFGRPDLGGQAEAWTPLLYDSLTRRLPAHVDDETTVLPAHFSTLDEADERGVFSATFGRLRRENAAYRYDSLETFTDFIRQHLPYFPPEYVEIKRVNAGLVRPTEEQAGELELGKNICALSE